MTNAVLDITSPLTGFDLDMLLPMNTHLSNGDSIIVTSDAIITVSGAYSYIKFFKEAGKIYVSSYADGIVKEKVLLACTDPHWYHVTYYHRFIAIVVDGVWEHTFYPEYMKYIDDTVRVWITPSFSCSMVVKKRELSDWRESIYVDLEMTSQNGISSLLQSRPVEQIGSSNGSLRFQYFPRTRPSKQVRFIKTHSIRIEESQQIASEALVYHVNVGVAVDTESIRRYGLITRVYRLPDLDSGAMKAAKVMQLQARQRVKSHTIEMRLDPQIEVGDAIIVGTNDPSGHPNDVQPLPGTGTQIYESIIVESISVTISDGRFGSLIRGRNYE